MASAVINVFCQTAKIGDFIVTTCPALNSGSYGTVHKAFNCKTGERCVVKKIEFPTPDKKIQTRAKSEIDVIKKLQNHKNIVELYDVIEFDNVHWIFMEQCIYGSLRSYLLDHKNIDIILKLLIKQQCAAGVAFMHKQKDPIIHRDIKLSNVLITMIGSRLVAKIADFGLSKVRDELASSEMKTRCGTNHHKSPELFEESPSYDQSVDVFALGLVFKVVLEYTERNQVLVPLTKDSKSRKRKYDFIGAEMLYCHSDGKPLPDILETDPSGVLEEEVQKIIVQMTQFHSKDRPKMAEVENSLTDLVSETLQNLSPQQQDNLSVPSYGSKSPVDYRESTPFPTESIETSVDNSRDCLNAEALTSNAGQESIENQENAVQAMDLRNIALTSDHQHDMEVNPKEDPNPNQAIPFTARDYKKRIQKHFPLLIRKLSQDCTDYFFKNEVFGWDDYSDWQRNSFIPDDVIRKFLLHLLDYSNDTWIEMFRNYLAEHHRDVFNILEDNHD